MSAPPGVSAMPRGVTAPPGRFHGLSLPLLELACRRAEHTPPKGVTGRCARTGPPEHIPSCLSGGQLCVSARTLQKGFIQHTNPNSVDDDELLPVGVGEERPGGAG